MTTATSPFSRSAGSRLRILFLSFLSLSLVPTLSDAAEGRVVTVGVYQNPPKIFLNDGRISGIFGDLLNAIARQEGWQIKPVVCQWKNCLEMLEHGRIDLMPDVAGSEQRRRVMNFPQVAALFSWSQLYKHKGVRIKSVRDLQGKRILVLAGSIQQPYLRHMIASFGLQAELVPMQDLPDAFAAVAEGKADAVAANHFFGDMEALHYHLENTPIMFQPVRLYFVSGKGRDGALLKTIDTYLQRWQNDPDSYYFQTLSHWNVAAHKAQLSPIWRWGLIGLVVMLLLALALAVLLRRQVREKSRNLRFSEEKLKVILDTVEAYIYIKGPDLRYQYVNRKVAELFGKPEEEVIGRGDDVFFDEATVANIHANDRKVLDNGERITFEEENRSKEGNIERAYLTVKQPLWDDQGNIYGLCGISTDITEHKRNQERIHRLAFYDPLTRLPNRRLLLDRVEHALSGYARTHSDGAVLFIDLDNFKVLNDTLGHAQGDVLLENIARRLSAHIRESDTLARLGGDEFVLLVENQGQDSEQALLGVEQVSRKLLLTFAEPCRLGERSYNITASIGVAMLSDANGKVEELLKRADMAMYEAKAAGRNQLKFFNPKMQADMDRRVEIEADLRDAIKHDEFVLHYQAQVDCNGHLLGVEALLRWQHPRKGMISPGAFIPVAESSGLILPLGRWVLHAACEQLLLWGRMPEMRHLYLAVNVSARQFHHPDFVTDVLAALKQTGVDPRHLELELTETLLVEDMEGVIAKMNQLKAHGVRFSLDDFGTGYSSLNYLKRLPLDQLKIDQSFVRDLLVDSNDLAIVRTVLALGSSLGLSVVAEGVESMDQRDELIRLGCDRLQGYLFGHPAPGESLNGIGSASS